MKEWQKYASDCYDKQEKAYNQGNREEARKWQKEGDRAMAEYCKREKEVQKEQQAKEQGHSH